MSTQIIEAFSERKRVTEDTPYKLRVSEFFCDTIQGEGIHVGHPAAFLRLQGCTLDCVWCDTKEVWRTGNPYTFEELFALMEKPGIGLIDKFRSGQHLVITGGSPLLQQEALHSFLYHFESRYGFLPYTEIENECMIMPNKYLAQVINCWNNSPKLDSSGNKTYYNQRVIYELNQIPNSWFKFVITCEYDWEQINYLYLLTKIISKSNVILMPEGKTRAEIEKNRNLVLSIAIENNVRYSPRMQVELWDKTVGV